MGSSDIWERYSKTRDPALKEKLVLRHLGLVKFLAGRLAISAPPTLTRDDLEGYGIIGLLDAIEKFNQTYGTEFKNYAYTRIRGAILDEIRKQNWVPRSKWRKFHRLNEIKDRFRQEGAGQPGETELAREMGIDQLRIRKLAAEYSNAFPVSLDDISGAESDGTLAETISDPNSPDPLEVVAEKEEKEALASAIEELPERDRLVLALYYQEGLTLKEIGSVLEVTESRVCQLHAKALQKLRDKLQNRLAPNANRKKGVR